MEKQKRIGTNFIFNLILKAVNVIFPMITFPYVARILGPTGIGKVNFASAFISYFIIFATIGIPSYGIREVAKASRDRLSLNKVYSELLTINLLTMLGCTLCLGACFFFIDKIQSDVPLFAITSLLLIFSPFSLDWFFSGMEDYKYISTRNIIIKVIYVVAVFVFIHNASDYLVFAALGVFVNCGNYVYNMFYVRKIVTFTLKKLDLKKHFKPIMAMFMISIVVSLYYTVTPIIIGFFSTDEQVGYFTAFLRIILIAGSMVSAYASVVYPRFSIYVDQKRFHEYQDLSHRSISLSYITVFPAIGLLLIFGKAIILLFAGQAFVEHVPIMWVMTPIIYLGAFSSLLQSQVLLPFKMEKKVIIAPTVGAMINFLVGAVLSKYYGAFGNAIALSLAELLVFIILLNLSKKVSTIKIFTPKIFLYLMVNVVLSAYFFYAAQVFNYSILSVIILSFCYGFVYLLALILVGEPNVLLTINFLRKKRSMA